MIRNKKLGLYIIGQINPNQSTRLKTVYVGSSLNLNRRFTEHKRDLKAGNHKNSRLQNLWNECIDSLPEDTKANSFNINSIFPHIKDFLTYKKTASFLFIPVFTVEMTDSLDEQPVSLKEELFSLESELASWIEKNLSIESLNSWLVLGTEDREGQAVCIEGVVYKSRPLAAQALGLLKNGKPDKQKIYQRVVPKKWANYFYIKNGFLEKKLEIRNSQGKLLHYETYHYGEVQGMDSNSPNVIYWTEPKFIEKTEVRNRKTS